MNLAPSIIPESSDFYKSLLDNLFDGVYFVDLERRITFWNKGAERLTGYTAGEVVGSCCWDNILCHVTETGVNLCTTACPLIETMACRKPHQADIYLKHKSGHRVPVQVRVAPIVDKKGHVTGAVEVFSDNSPQLRMQHELHRLEQMASLDKLTEVSNRRYGEIALSARLQELERHGWCFGVLFLDIDDFKGVNDRHGHETGDLALKMVARTLAANLRGYDNVVRWGGEEFVVILAQIKPEQLGAIAEKVRMLIANNGLLISELPATSVQTSRDRRTGQRSTITVKAPGGEEGAMLKVTVSIGATMARPGDTVESLIGRADTLMFESKKSGKNKTSVDDGD